jgi:predicted regulator of amino acid metabolism with ACT domain
MLVTKNLSHRLTQITLTATLALGGVMLGIIPEFSDNFSRLQWTNEVVAQSITNEEINKYAQAVLAIESLRQQAFNDIGKIMGTNVLNEISCNQPQSLNILNREARAIAQKYCQSSQKIVKNTGLTSKKFNEITTSAQSNPELQKRIQNAMIQIRNK